MRYGGRSTRGSGARVRLDRALISVSVSPVRLVVHAPDYYVLERAYAEAVVAMWQGVGINADLELRPHSHNTLALRRGNTRDHVLNISSSRTSDPIGNAFSQWARRGVIQTEGWWAAASAARFNELGQQVQRTFERHERAAVYQQLLDEWEREAPGTPLLMPETIAAMKRSIDFTPGDHYQLDLRPSNFRLG